MGLLFALAPWQDAHPSWVNSSWRCNNKKRLWPNQRMFSAWSEIFSGTVRGVLSIRGFSGKRGCKKKKKKKRSQRWRKTAVAECSVNKTNQADRRWVSVCKADTQEHSERDSAAGTHTGLFERSWQTRFIWIQLDGGKVVWVSTSRCVRIRRPCQVAEDDELSNDQSGSAGGSEPRTVYRGVTVFMHHLFIWYSFENQKMKRDMNVILKTKQTSDSATTQDRLCESIKS